MKKFAFLLLVLSLARVGVAYADTTDPQSNKYVTGKTAASTNANEILYFYNGADGKDGKAGRDGKDGKDGKTGATGATGATGSSVATTSFSGERGGCTNGGIQINAVNGVTYLCNGSSGNGVLSVLFTGSRGNCSNGGIQFTDSKGTLTYACNGRNGLDGSDGAPGSITSTTSGSISSSTLGEGQVATRTCDPDGVVKVTIGREYNGTGFNFTSFGFGDNTTNGDLGADCANKPLDVYIAIDTATALSSTRFYQPSDTIKCSGTIGTIGTSNPQFVLEDILNGTTLTNICVVTRRSSAATTYVSGTAGAQAIGVKFRIVDIDTSHFVGNIGFTIG